MNSTLLILLATLTVSYANTQPTGLLADFQKNTALGVRAEPHFTWIVPPCSSSSLADQMQSAYQIKLSNNAGKLVWDSGKVPSSESANVGYSGPALAPGSFYHWTVTTWTQNSTSFDDDACVSKESAPATLVTALFDGFDKSAEFMQLQNSSTTFAYFRKCTTIPSGLKSAAAFITARNDDPLLAGYKLFINGETVNIGPGRGTHCLPQNHVLFSHFFFFFLSLIMSFCVKTFILRRVTRCDGAVCDPADSLSLSAS